MRKTLCEGCKFYSLEKKKIRLNAKFIEEELTEYTFKVCSAFYPPIYINGNSSECNFYKEKKTRKKK